MLEPQNWVLLAGFGHVVSKTRLACASLGSHVNVLARTLVQIEADWRRILETRDSVSQTTDKSRWIDKLEKPLQK